MTEFQKRDASVSMEQANLYGIFFALPAAIIQVGSFTWLYGLRAFEPDGNIGWLVVVTVLGIVVHEWIHGLSWAFFGRKPFSAIRFGFMWKTLTPYAHINEPLEVNAYRLGTFLPGLLLGIIPFFVARAWGSGDWMWFSLLHTSAACGDWLILWLIRRVRPGDLVEDHPTRAGCYVFEKPVGVA